MCNVFNFPEYSSFNEDISNWDVSNVINMSRDPMGSEVGADYCNQRQNETQISYDLVPVSKSEIDAMESTIGGRGVKKPQKRVT